MKLKKGDNVVVISGKDRGRQAKILRVFPKVGKILVEGVNLVRVREKARRAGQKGQTVERAMPLDASNVLIWCGHCKRGRRIGYKIEGGKKVRVCKKCGREL